MVLISDAAQRKLQEIRESHDFCCITIKSDFDYVWDIDVVWDEERFHRLVIVCPDHSHEELNDAVDHLHDYWKANRTSAKIGE